MGNILYLVIPAYNEKDTIEQITREWHKVAAKTGKESRLVIIDDGSKDATYQRLCSLKEELEQLEIITKENEGHGPSLLYGYRYALKAGADFIFQTDSDGQTDPAEFWKFWKLRNQFDLVIGYRRHRQDGFLRIFVSRMLRVVIKRCFGVCVLDANTPYRLMRADGLKENMKYIPRHFNLPNIILTVIYTKKGQRIKYIPITFRQRQGGRNSIDFCKICKIGVKALKDFKRINASLCQKKHQERASW